MATESLPNTIVANSGFPVEEMDGFTSMPRVIVHPQTKEELLGVKLTDSGRNTLLRSDGFAYYREVDPSSGRLVADARIVRTITPDTGEVQWLENAGLRGGGDIINSYRVDVTK